MRKTTLSAGLACLFLLASLTAGAQSLGDLAKAAATSLTGDKAGAATGVLSALIGTETVSPKKLAGTWTYAQPAIAFESENLLTKAGGAAVASTVEKKLGTTLAQYGIAAGAFAITFKADGTFSCTLKGKSRSGTYTVDKATLSFYIKETKTKVTSANVKLSGSTLQLTFTADKLLAYAQMIGSVAGQASTPLATLTALTSAYKGMQLGMEFKKK